MCSVHFSAIFSRLLIDMKLKWIVLFSATVALSFLLLIPKKQNPSPAVIVESVVPSAPVTASKPAAGPKDFHEWIRESRTQTSDAVLGRHLAEAHGEQIRQLMKSNPRAALAAALSWSDWAALPAELQTLVERPFSDQVEFQLLPDCPPIDHDGQNQRRIFLEGQWRRAHVFGSKEKMTSKLNLPARGIVFGEEAVLADDAVEAVSGADLETVRELFPAGGRPGVSWLSNRAVSADARTILLGGAVYDLASEEEEHSVTRLLADAEQSLHPNSVAMALSVGAAGGGTIAFDLESAKASALVANSTWTETAKRTLAVRISYPDTSAADIFTLTDLTNLMTQASNTVKVMSYGKSWIVPTVVAVTLPNNHATYESGGADSIVNATRDALLARGINTANYDFVVHAHPPHNFGYAGLGVIGGGTSWINGKVSLEVTVHEMGHNYGLGHAHYWYGITGNGSLGRNQPGSGDLIEREEYGDTFDIMGGSTLPAGQYSAHGKVALNWIEQKEVIKVVTNGIYRVYRYDHKDARTNAGTKLALQINCPGGEEYWVSHRRLFTGNATLTRGAHIHRADGGADQSLIDATPLSKPLQGMGVDKDDSALAIGRSFTDSLGTIRITTIASAGVAPLEYLDVQVTFLDSGAFSFYTTSSFQTNGLLGSYVNRSLRDRPAHEDWTKVGVGISGRRVDRVLSFTSNGWGTRAPVGVTGGTDADWENFSVQWDGFIVVRRPVRLATVSDDSSRLYIDLNRNGVFSTIAPEFVNNHWGTGQGATRGDISGVIPPGTYAIRIQYEEGNGGNYFTLAGAELPFEFFTSAAATTRGLTGSYVARNLRTVTQNDWRSSQTIAGTRVDAYPGFTVNGWGNLTNVGFTSANGANGDWENFSVQWDGYLSNSVPIRAATISDDHSRMWIDLNTNGSFSASSPELINNGWGGGGQGMTVGVLSQVIPPGLYQIRIQYEEGNGGNGFLFAGTPSVPTDAPVLFNGLSFTGKEAFSAPRRGSGDFTIEFWFRTSQIAGDETHWTNGMGLIDASAGAAPGFGVSLGNGRILFGINEEIEQTIRSDFFADGQWHYAAARRDTNSGEITLFIDAIEQTRAPGGTNLLDGAVNMTIGSLSDGSNDYIGNLDAIRIWETARTDAQIAADFHTSRAGHIAADAAPEVHITRLQPNSYQIHWDALSSYRKLEAATSITGPWTPLLTDQNSTNVPIGANSNRYFQVKK